MEYGIDNHEGDYLTGIFLELAPDLGVIMGNLITGHELNRTYGKVNGNTLKFYFKDIVDGDVLTEEEEVGKTIDITYLDGLSQEHKRVCIDALRKYEGLNIAIKAALRHLVKGDLLEDRINNVTHKI